MNLAKGEARAGRGQPQIAGGQDFAATADGVAVDGGDDRAGQGDEGIEGGAHDAVQPFAGGLFRVVGQLLQIATGDERRARAGDDERPRVGGPRRGHGLGEPLLGAPGQGIAGRGTVNAQQGHAVAVDVELDTAIHSRNDTRNRVVARFRPGMAGKPHIEK